MTISQYEGGPSPEERRNLPAARDLGGRDLASDANAGRAGVPSEGLIGMYPYSGADAKLVVHLPPEDSRDTDSEITSLQSELEQIGQQLENTPDEGADTIESRLTVLRRQRSNEAALATIYPEGSDERAASEAQVAVYDEEISDLTVSLLTNGSNRAQREDLLERQVALTRSLAAAQENGEPSGSTSRTKTLAEIATFSWSIHREKYPYRPLGACYPKTVTRGPRTVSGSMVLVTFNQHVFSEFLEASALRSTGVGDFDRHRWTSYITDQIPPIDISVSFANEYGNLSWMSVLGVDFVNEGGVISIEDLYMEGTLQYMARDIDLIRSVANRTLTPNIGVSQEIRDTSGSSLMAEEFRRRQQGRNVPWL